MGTHVDIRTSFEAITCWGTTATAGIPCGVQFALTTAFSRKVSENGAAFFCPKGCRLSYGEGPLAAVKRELEDQKAETRRARERTNDMRWQRERAERSASAYKGQATRIRNRVGKGVCPCCNRTFANVARHMESQHPEMAEGAK